MNMHFSKLNSEAGRSSKHSIFDFESAIFDGDIEEEVER